MDGLQRIARPLRDSAAARQIDEAGFTPLLNGHRLDHRLESLEVLIVEIDVLQRGADTRQHAEHLLERPHLADHVQLRQEVFEVEAALLQFLGLLLGLALIDHLLGLLDQADNVAHTEDAPSHAARIKHLEVFRLLTDTGEQDRAAGDLDDRQRRATARITIGLGQDQSVQWQARVELLGRVDGVLAEHRVTD